MMVIFGAMAQLVPVVLEVGHFAVDLYYVIYPLLFIGSIMMMLGFYTYPLLLPFGGVIAFIAFGIFLFETFLTIYKVKIFNFVITTVAVANSFLLLGLIIGIFLALGYSGIIIIDINLWLISHVYSVVIGYVTITIMGMSMVLLPMFWLSHNFSWKLAKIALLTLSIAIISIFLSSLLKLVQLEYLGYILTIFALFLYFCQIYIIYKKRVRIEKDIYLKSMLFSYGSLISVLLLSVIYFYYPLKNLLLSLSWLGFSGFIVFIITGHLYKIIPFLVWYERFSVYVGKKKVPMLADMVPLKSANMQFLFNTIGVILVFLALLLDLELLYKSGVSFLTIGTIFLIKDILFMINFKGDSNGN